MITPSPGSRASPIIQSSPRTGGAELAATGGSGTAALKFVIVGFGDHETQTTRFLDARFYGFHDEWYWFRLINGQRVPGSRARPLGGPQFATIAAILDWVRVRVARPGAAVEITRVAQSTELPSTILTKGAEARATVVDDAQVKAVFRAPLASAEQFLEVENLPLDPARARRRVTVDIEFRELAEGWPAAKHGPPAPERIVLKQVRSLDPGVPPGAERLLEQPIPRELLLFADRIEQRTCRTTRTRVDLVEVWIDPIATPDLGHGQVPFVIRARVQARGFNGGPIDLDFDHSVFARSRTRASNRAGGGR